MWVWINVCLFAWQCIKVNFVVSLILSIWYLVLVFIICIYFVHHSISVARPVSVFNAIVNICVFASYSYSYSFRLCVRFHNHNTVFTCSLKLLFSWLVQWWGDKYIHQTSLRRKLFMWFFSSSSFFLSIFLTVFASWLYKQIIPEAMNLAHIHLKLY